jgi:hypothetical protein
MKLNNIKAFENIKNNMKLWTEYIKKTHAKYMVKGHFLLLNDFLKTKLTPLRS